MSLLMSIYFDSTIADASKETLAKSEYLAKIVTFLVINKII